MIPISEIEKLIKDYENALNGYPKGKDRTNIVWGKIEVLEKVIHHLKELIPSEPNNQSERIPTDTERT